MKQSFMSLIGVGFSLLSLSSLKISYLLAMLIFLSPLALGQYVPLLTAKVVKNVEISGYVIELDDTPVIRKKRQLSRQNPSASLANVTKVNTLLKQQYNKRRLFSEKLKAEDTSAVIVGESRFIFNGLTVNSNLTKPEILKLPYVKNVYAMREYRVQLAQALSITQVDPVWEALAGRTNAGQGVKIAIIDSGIVPSHPMFDDAGMLPPNSETLPQDDYCRTLDPNFCNNKIIVARRYPPAGYQFSLAGESDSPLGLSGHGSHVAGIAAGRVVSTSEGEVISGVAPAAYLMVYKALWGQQGTGTDVELLAALEDAYNDGADIVNNSWGANVGAHPIDSLYQSIFQDFERAGITVVSAAGNEGDSGTQTIVCPGCIESGITVGATTTNRVAGHALNYNDRRIHSKPGDSYVTGNSFAAEGQIAPDNNQLGCLPYENSLTDKVVVVFRGECFFAEKARHARQANAAALIVVNNVPGPTITMAMGEETNLLSTMVTASDGQQLIDDLKQMNGFMISMEGQESQQFSESSQDLVAEFSSRGPNGNDAFIKPDITAPGVEILSATSSSDQDSLGKDFTRFSGTSMATPMVAGAVALLKQKWPQMSAKQLKHLIMSTASVNARTSSGANIATPFESGAGRLNIERAFNAEAMLNQIPSVIKNCVVRCEFFGELISLVDDSRTWQISVEFDEPDIVALVENEVLSTTSLNESTQFEFIVELSPHLPTDWYFGRIKLTNEVGQQVHQRIAISNEALITELVETNITEIAGDYLVNIQGANRSGNDEVEIELTLNGAVEFISDELSVMPEPYDFYWRDDNKLASFQLSLQNESIDFREDAPPFAIDIANHPARARVNCFASCDEFYQFYSFPFVLFNQQQTGMAISDNGSVVAGNVAFSSPNLSENLAFPSERLPNGIIAPFWSDFDLKNSNSFFDTGGGNIYTLEHEFDGDTYLIIQWDAVKLWSNTDVGVDQHYWGISDLNLEFSFQLIVKQLSNDIWYRYLSIPEQPRFYSVGLENSDATAGATYHFDGTGPMLISDMSLYSEYRDAETFLIDLNIVTAQVAKRMHDKFEGIEDQTLSFERLSDGDTILPASYLTVGVADTFQSFLLKEQQPATVLNLDSYKLIIPPQNGTLESLPTGVIVYKPIADYAGADSFSYQINTIDGALLQHDIEVWVEAVNDAPEIISFQVPNNVDLSESFSVNLEVIDVDSEVEVEWSFSESFELIKQSENKLELRAPALSDGSALFVEVFVSDEERTVSAIQNLTLDITTELSNDADSDGIGSGQENEENTEQTSSPPTQPDTSLAEENSANVESASKRGSSMDWLIYFIVLIVVIGKVKLPEKALKREIYG